MRIRVRNPHRHGRWVVGIVGVFVIVQVLLAAMQGAAAQTGFPTFAFLVWVAVAVGAMVPMRCQHLLWCAIYGAVIGAAPIVTSVTAALLRTGGSGSLGHPTSLVTVAGVAALGATLGSITLPLWAVFYRYVVCRVEIQDGTLCPTCTYCITGLPTNICPECGSEFDSDLLKTARSPRSAGSHRRGRKAVACLVACLALVSAGGLWLASAPPLYVLWTPSYWRNILRGRDEPRGRAFYELSALLIDEARKGRVISTAEVRSVLGPPDLFAADAKATCYLYFFTYPGRSEAYIDFADDVLTGGGYNATGVNDLSGWQPYAEEPAEQP